jgi:hypothetical protein
MNNFPPVGDIKIAKSKGTYNTYKLELSYGQMECIVQALEAKHDDAIADELLAMFHYYMHELPGPGEDEEQAEQRKDTVTGDGGGEDDLPVPMPPGAEGDLEGALDDGGGEPLPDLPAEDEMEPQAGPADVEGVDAVPNPDLEEPEQV